MSKKKPSKAQEELKAHILAERAKGNIVFQAMPGEFMSAPLEAFLKQPADGILYDLNRLEEIALTFIHEPKWVNDFAVALVIRKLVEQRDAAQTAAPEARPCFNCGLLPQPQGGRT